MKYSILASAILGAIAIMPSGASANYYGYFGCSGELADVTIAALRVEEHFGFAKDESACSESARRRNESDY